METVTTEIIPSSAWVQAVFVCLFIVLIIWLLSWMSKRDETTRQFQSAESDKWQVFIAKENENWREYNRKQREENNCAMAKVDESLTNLAMITGKLVTTVDEMRTDIYQHDIQAKEILSKVTKVQRTPRANGNSTDNKEK
jgi:uncharacterized membrane protein YhiD involved in acid resistance